MQSPRFKILVVDDDEEFFKLIEHDLRKKDYDVTYVRTEKEAISLLETTQFSCAIIDIVLGPHETSAYLVHYLASCEPQSLNYQLPIILCSAYMSEAFSSRIKNKGLNLRETLMKPFPPGTILNRMEEFSTRNVLVLDDDPEFRVLVERELRGLGFNPFMAANLEEAKGYLENVKLLCGIFDIILGEKLTSGEAIHFLKDEKSKLNTHIPLIITSAYLTPAHVAVLKQKTKMVAFAIPKPASRGVYAMACRSLYNGMGQLCEDLVPDKLKDYYVHPDPPEEASIQELPERNHEEEKIVVRGGGPPAPEARTRITGKRIEINDREISVVRGGKTEIFRDEALLIRGEKLPVEDEGPAIVKGGRTENISEGISRVKGGEAGAIKDEPYVVKGGKTEILNDDIRVVREGRAKLNQKENTLVSGERFVPHEGGYEFLSGKEKKEDLYQESPVMRTSSSTRTADDHVIIEEVTHHIEEGTSTVKGDRTAANVKTHHVVKGSNPNEGKEQDYVLKKQDSSKASDEPIVIEEVTHHIEDGTTTVRGDKASAFEKTHTLVKGSRDGSVAEEDLEDEITQLLGGEPKNRENVIPIKKREPRYEKAEGVSEKFSYDDVDFGVVENGHEEESYYESKKFKALSNDDEKLANIDDRNSSGETKLMMQASRGNYSEVKELIEKGANIQLKSRSGKTALHYCAATGDMETLKLLLDNGAKLTARDDEELEPLGVAILGRRVDVASELLKRGSRLGTRIKRRSYLLVAEELENFEIFKALLDAGADILVRDPESGFSLVEILRKKRKHEWLEAVRLVVAK